MKRALAMAAAILTLGCASVFLATQDNVTSKQRYFALVSDYVDAKEAALPIMQSPAVSRETKQKILDVVRATDERITTFETWRKTQNEGDIPDSRYEVLNAIISAALTELLKYGVQHAYAGAVLVLLQILTVIARHYGLDDRVQNLVLGSIGKLRLMVKEGRDPTEEEFAELFAEFQEATDALEEAFEEGAGSDGGLQQREAESVDDWFDRVFNDGLTDGESG